MAVVDYDPKQTEQTETAAPDATLEQATERPETLPGGPSVLPLVALFLRDRSDQRVETDAASKPDDAPTRRLAA